MKLHKVFALVLLLVTASAWGGAALFVVSSGGGGGGGAGDGTWSEIASSDPAQVLNAGSGSDGGTSGYAGVINAWSSGAWDEGRNRLYIFGGGHGDSSNNGVYSYDMDTNAWATLREFTQSPPCYGTNGNGALVEVYEITVTSGTFTDGEAITNDTQANAVGTSCSTDAVFTGTRGTTYLYMVSETNKPAATDTISGDTSGATATIDDNDGSTCASVEEYPSGEASSRHTYGGMTFMPASGARGDDHIFITGGSLPCGAGGFGTDVWWFNLSTNAWVDKGTGKTSLAQSRCAYYQPNDLVYCLWATSAGGLKSYNPDTNSFSTVVATTIADVDPLSDAAVQGSNIWWYGGGSVYKFDVDAGTFGTESFTGSTDIIQASRRAGFTWDPHRHGLIAWDAQSTEKAPTLAACSLWEFDIEDATITEFTHAGCGITANTGGAGILGKFAYSTDLRQLVAVFDADDNVFEYNSAPLTYTFTAKEWSGVFPCSDGACKHMRLVEDPTSGLIYAFGGDHTPSDGAKGFGQSGRNEAYKYDASTNTWTEIHDYCPNMILPSGQDEVGMDWDPINNVIWSVDGFYFSSADRCHVSTGTATGTNSTTLTDSAATFQTDGAVSSHWVFNDTANEGTTQITSVDSETQITTDNEGNDWTSSTYYVGYEIVNEVMSFDPDTETWSVDEPKSEGIAAVIGWTTGNYSHAVVDPDDGNIYLFNEGVVRELDVGTNVLSTAIDSGETGNRDVWPVLVPSERKVYHLDHCDVTPGPQMDILDLATDTWSAGADPPTPVDCGAMGAGDMRPFYYESKDKIIWLDWTDEFNDARGLAVHVYHVETGEWDSAVDYTRSSDENLAPLHIEYSTVHDVAVMYGKTSLATDLWHLEITR